MLDYIDINTYFEFFRSQNERSGDDLANLLRKLILNEQGEPVIGPEDQLPIDITVSVILKVSQILGKSNPKSSTQEPGTPQE
jgi:hypothetical protein